MDNEGRKYKKKKKQELLRCQTTENEKKCALNEGKLKQPQNEN